uniref:Somatostatin/Cortistatin C-terminal domain-containing protein n=1 Tax=Oncorhynchus mykiss TaxID=8022 RepID=A0A8C7SSR7_ONCMY
AAGFRVGCVLCQEAVWLDCVVFRRMHGSRPSPLLSPLIYIILFSTRSLQDLSHILLLKMLDLMTTAAGENEVLPDLEEALWVRSEVVRQLPLNQRECKAGCQNFYWKTFTSC